MSLDRSLKLLGAQHGFLAGAGSQFCLDTILQEPLGMYVLLLDSDSRMGEEALFPLVSEMELDPSVGFLQVCTRPMLVVRDYFENFIGLFTERIFFIAFVYSCSNGMPAPLVGHNVLLRCEAMERVAWYDETGRQLHWAEDKVSEVSSQTWTHSAGWEGRRERLRPSSSSLSLHFHLCLLRALSLLLLLLCLFCLW